MTQEVHYLMTTRDIAHLSHRITQKTPVFRRRRRFAGMLVGIAGLLFFSSLPLGPLSIIIISVFMMTSSWLMFGAQQKPSDGLHRYFEQLYEDGKNRGVLGPHRMLLHEEHLEVQTHFSQTSIKWEGLDRIEEDEEYLYFFVSAINAYVVRKAAFTSEEHKRTFLATARQNHQRALQLETHEFAGMFPHPEPNAIATTHPRASDIYSDDVAYPPAAVVPTQPYRPAPRPVSGGEPGTDGSV